MRHGRGTKTLTGKVRYVIWRWRGVSQVPMSTTDCWEAVMTNFYAHLIYRASERQMREMLPTVGGTWNDPGETLMIGLRESGSVPNVREVNNAMRRVAAECSREVDDGCDAGREPPRMPYKD